MGIIGVRQLNRDSKRYLELVEVEREPFVITRHGRPIAALIPVDPGEAERYLLAASPEFLQSRKEADQAGPNEPSYALEEVARELRVPAADDTEDAQDSRGDSNIVEFPDMSRLVVGQERMALAPVIDILGYLRAATGIPTEPVGSFPRPAKLQAAYADYDAGNISKEDLEVQQDAAVKDSIERMEATGSPINSDGEQRWSSFATYPITDTLAGTGLAPNLGPGGQFFAIFADGHGRQLPKLTGGPLKYNQYAADALSKSIKYATKPLKQAVIAPSMLALLYPLNDEVPGYTREAFEEDIVQECVTDIRKAFEAGAARVSIDFTEGRLATREDPRNPWTGAGLLPHFIELNNRVLENFSDEERAKIGIHTCPGGDRDSVHSADVPYNNLLPEMFKINAGYFLIQLASERDKDPVYESIGQHSREDQMCYIGVTVTQSPRPESAQEICDNIVRAADFIPKERLGTTDDCGFSPFSIDEKPNHGSPDYAREIAFQKIANRVEGTRRAAEKLRVA